MIPKGVRNLLLTAALLAVALPAGKTLRRWADIHTPELFKLDFALYYATAQQGRSEGFRTLYDVDAQRRAFTRVSPELYLFPTTYTPPMAMLVVPLSFLSLDRAYRIWSLLLLLSLAICAGALAPGRPLERLLQAAMVLVPYPAVLGLQEGQVIALQMAAVGVAVWLLRRGREAAAGVALLPLVLKPQGFVLVPFALLVSGRRRAFTAFLVAALLLGFAVLSVIGLDGARAYLARLAYASAHPREFWVGYAYTATMHFSTAWGRALMQATAVLLALFAAFRHRGRVEMGLAAAILASLLASPYLHLYDLTLLFVAGWLTLRALPSPLTAMYLLVVYVFLVLCTHQNVGIAGRWVLLLEAVWLVALSLLPPKLYAPSSSLRTADSGGSAASLGESSGSFSGQAMPIPGSSQRTPISSARS